MSRLNYTPSTDLDYGTISCWAKNSIGTQKSPCVFQIVAAGKHPTLAQRVPSTSSSSSALSQLIGVDVTLSAGRPFPLQNCSVTNQSVDSLQVDCLEGFDGGLPQGFMLELVELNTLRLARNITVSVSFRIGLISTGILITQRIH